MMSHDDQGSTAFTSGECMGGPCDGDLLLPLVADDVRAVWVVPDGSEWSTVGRRVLYGFGELPRNQYAQRLGIYRFEPDRHTWTWIPDTKLGG
jgi:hypothetical protein